MRSLDGRVAKIKHLGYWLSQIAVDGTSCAMWFRAHADSNSCASQQNCSDEGSENGARGKLKFSITDALDLTLMDHTDNTVGTGFHLTHAFITPGNTCLFSGSPFTQALKLPGITPSWRTLNCTSPLGDAGARYRDNDYSAIIKLRNSGTEFARITPALRAYAKAQMPGQESG